MMMIPARIYREIIDYCEAKLPEEACGALIGRTETADTGEITQCTVYGFVPLANAAAEDREHRFTLDPGEWIHTLFAAQRHHRQVVGLLHSHPSTPPIPSLADRSTLWTDVPSHWIVSLADPEAPDVKAYRFKHIQPEDRSSSGAIHNKTSARFVPQAEATYAPYVEWAIHLTSDELEPV